MGHPARRRMWWLVAALLVLVAFGVVRVLPALVSLFGGG